MNNATVVKKEKLSPIKSHAKTKRESSGVKSFHCIMCQKLFRTAEFLNCHMRTHTKEKPYNCPQCFKEIAEPGNLLKHIKKFHKEDQEIQNLESCELSNSSEKDERESAFKCNHCSKTFARKDGLKRHMFSHSTGQRPHKCSECYKSFSQKQELIHHINSSHNTGEKPHCCSLCDSRFVRKTDLRVHQRHKHNF